MPSADEEFLKRFYQQLEFDPIDPGSDPRYVPIYDDRASTAIDPVVYLQGKIEWESVDSAHLFSGFRGTGKSTELRRLKRRLEAGGAVVVLCDMKNYLNMTTPVDVSDFLLAAAGAFGDELARDKDLIGESVIAEGYWTRFWAFLQRTQVELREVGLEVKGDVGGVEGKAQIKLNLKDDPTFRQVLQKKLAGHLGALVRDVHKFFGECILALRKKHNDENLRVVMILDSVEHMRGTSLNAADVAASLENLFDGHADKLRIPSLHSVYTVPPWLKIKVPGVAGQYTSALTIPCVKVRHRNGVVCNGGLKELEAIVAKRGDWRRLLGDQAALDEVLLASGGYMRDLFRLFRTVLGLSRNDGLPASERVRKLAIDEVRNSYLPIAHADARWLSWVHESKDPNLASQADLPDLARFFDTHLVLTYRNGERNSDEWVDVHPLVVEQVEKQVAALAEREAGKDRRE